MNTPTNNKKQLLDPIGTLCHIISLAFKPLNTKIGINNHAIIIQEPSYYQIFNRTWNSDNRENISLLYNIVIRIIEWYIVPLSKKYDDNEDFEIDPLCFDNLTIDDKQLFWKCLEKMIQFSCLAFEKLQYTYYNGPTPTNVVLATQFFINTLRDSLAGNYSRNNLPKCMVEGENKNFIDYDKIKLLWSGKKLLKIIDLYEKCFATQKSDDPTKEEQIIGYMSAINKLLSIHDEEFRKLIYLSNVG